jgi:hypothetical protein
MPVMGVHVFEMPKVPAPAALVAAGLAPEPRDMRDTIIVPAQQEGFEGVFLGENAWRAIRIAEKHRPNLKWIASYQTLPVAAVTHLAEIDHFEPYGDTEKWKVVFKARAAPLERPIPFGDAPVRCNAGTPLHDARSALLGDDAERSHSVGCV